MLQLLISFKHKTSIYDNKVGPYSALSGGWVGESSENEEVFGSAGEVWMLFSQRHGMAGREAVKFAARETDLAFTFA